MQSKVNHSRSIVIGTFESLKLQIKKIKTRKFETLFLNERHFKFFFCKMQREKGRVVFSESFLSSPLLQSLTRIDNKII